MIVLRVIQGVLAAFTAAIAVMFGKDYSKNKETDVSKGRMGLFYGIGFITNFFDTLGIGSFAQTLAMYKLSKTVKDKLIPGTHHVGDSIPVIIEAFLFITVIQTETITLASMLACGMLGGFTGVKFAKDLPVRGIRLTMGFGLLVAAVLMLLSKFGVMPIGGDAVGLSGGKLILACVLNFVLGVLLPLGVGNYAPCMVIVYLLGMAPSTAFPIMMGTGALVLCATTVRFIPAAIYHRKAALGLIVGGIPGVLIAAFIVKSMPISILQWLVIIVVLYGSYTLLKQAFGKNEETAEELTDAAVTANTEAK